MSTTARLSCLKFPSCKLTDKFSFDLCSAVNGGKWRRPNLGCGNECATMVAEKDGVLTKEAKESSYETWRN